MASRELIVVLQLTCATMLFAARSLAAEPPMPPAWPGWRGPAHDGVASSAELVDSFPSTGPPVLWMRELGPGYSGFAVADGRAFTQYQSLYAQTLVCLNAETGETIWSYATGWPYDGGGLYPGPRATPTVAAGKVYFATPEGEVGCVAAADGKLLWSVNVHRKFSGRGTGFGYSSSPLVSDGLVIVPVGGEGASVVALNADRGTTVWKSGSRPASYSTPLPIAWQGEPLVVVLLQNSLACFHRLSGELWWELPLSQGYDEHAAAPIYREPYLLVANPFRAGAQAYRLQSDPQTGRCQPEPVWDSPQLSNDVASSVLVADTVYGFDLREPQSRLHRPSRGEFRALDFMTGNVRWSSTSPGHAQIIAADGKLILFNDRGEVILARSSPERYEELGRTTVFPEEICWTAPALAKNRLYLRTHTRAACLYLGRTPLVSHARHATVSEIPRTRRFDPGRLLGAEREYPATLPEWAEFRRWFAWSVGGLIVGWMLAGGIPWMGRYLRSSAGQIAMPTRSPGSEALFLTTIFLWGVLGSLVLHRLQADYVFTWPLALWAGFQLALAFSRPARLAPFWSRERAVSYGVGCLFLLICGLYFHCCRWLGLAIEWAFLTGFLAAFPVALLAAWLGARADWRSRIGQGLAYLASFSLYYWSSVWFMQWWLRPGA